jgi:Zn-dependent protease with chaperone function
VTESFIVLAAVLASGVFYWWSGRHLVRRPDDPALPERILIRQQHAMLVLVLSCVLLMYAAGMSFWLAFVGLLVASWIGDYPSRRVVFDETWTLGAYLRWHARFTTGYLGFWFGVLAAPSIIQAAGAWRWPVAGTLAAVLGVWGHHYSAVLLWIVRARPLAAAEAWVPILERSQAPPPRLLAMPVPGGRFVNAFALPSSRTASVLFSEPLLELLDAREQAAILAHEMAHLEHYDRRRCRIAAVSGVALVVLATLGAALALDWLGGGVLVLAWSAGLILAFALRTSRQRAHETESDLRALALCQDADALISGLTKLTTAGRVPRRWSSEIERHASHPSLARRLQAIRRAAGMAPESLRAADVLVVSTAPPGGRVILDDRGVSWLGGIGTAERRDPALLRQLATTSWAVPYTDLVELRVVASWWGAASLRVRDRAGTSRTVRIAADDLHALQQRLDAVEHRLAHDAQLAAPSPVVARLTAIGLWGVSIGSLFPLGLVIGVIALVRPSRAALAAVAGTAGACVLVVFGDLADGGRHWTQAASATGAILVAAVAAWLAARPPASDWRRSDYVPVLAAAGVAVAGTAAYVAGYALWMRPSPSLMLDTLAGTPMLWASVGVIGCALVTGPGRAVRGAGMAVVVAAVLINLGVRVGELEALTRVVAPPASESRPLPRLASFPLRTQGGWLRVSPLGTRMAVAERSRPHEGDRRFTVLDATGGRTEVEGHDLYFIDEGTALSVGDVTEGASLQQLDFADPTGVTSTWRTVLAGVRGLRLSSVHGSGWAGLGFDASTDDHIGVIGRFGAADFRRQRLHGDDMTDVGTVALAPDGRGLRTTGDAAALARLPWAVLLYAGRLSMESRVWRVDGERAPHLVASLPAMATCQLAGSDLGTAVCVGTDSSRTLIWRFDLAAKPSPPLIVPGRGWRSAVSRDGRLVALWTQDDVVTVDLDRTHATRWTLSPATGYPIDLVPAGDRLIALRYASAGASVEVYDTRSAVREGRATP